MHLMFVSPIIGETIYLSRPIQGFIGKTVIVVLMRVDLEWSARTVINQSTKQTQSIGARRPSPCPGRPSVRAQRAASRLSVLAHPVVLVCPGKQHQTKRVAQEPTPRRMRTAEDAKGSPDDKNLVNGSTEKRWNRVDRVQRKWLAREARQVHHIQPHTAPEDTLLHHGHW